MTRARSTWSSPFAFLIEEVRLQNLSRHRASGRGRPQPHTPGAQSAQPDITLETRAVSGPPRASRARRMRLLPVSVVLHSLLVLAVLVLPLMMPESLPPTTSTARAFFVEPVLSPPPPPPPPPRPAAAPRVKPVPVRSETQALIAPVEAPTEIKPEEGLDLGNAGGAPGGVEGGVAGGVVGGVVGGLPQTPPMQPVRVGGMVKEPKKLKHVAPVYPELARKVRLRGLVILECTIDPAGRVTDVKVLRGVPMLNEAAMDAVKQWVFTPTLLNGIPVPVVMTLTITFNLEE